MKVDVVIPTWNSMPEFETCLASIDDNIPSSIIGDILVIDRDSSDGTKETAERHGCTVLRDDVSLGSARMKGVEYADSDVILFIDSDIAIPSGWYDNISRYWDEDVGMLFGRTIDTNKYGKIKRYKIQRDFNDSRCRILSEGDRGFTHNTFIRRDLIKDLDISEYNAWEDYIITQHILEQDFSVIETQDIVWHLHSEVNCAKVGWNIQGILQVKKSLLYAMAFWNYYLYEGLISAIHFRDIDMLRWGIVNWLDGFKAFTQENARGDDES